MAKRTYYHILGISRDAGLEEITAAKNALAKVYHPDANIHTDIDTTAQMQEILEAYRILSNPEKRKAYDLELGGGKKRVFRTFNMEEEAKQAKKKPEADSFVTYWNAAQRLNEIVTKSSMLIQRESKRKSIPIKILEKFGNKEFVSPALNAELEHLSIEALKYITTLKTANIPMQYWNSETMNWLLIQWGQGVYPDHQTLLAQYDVYLAQNKTSSERMKLNNENKQFHHHLKKLLTYAL
ncbi:MULTISPECIES: J domain-containing protein [Clostridia]|jgi:curved DNA-binding protein CbpA|uniref:J domain-containing protein n=1 Tax=Clostridia TaxID=186801 RepID=UPI000EB49458|nr:MULTISPECIES: DnaJ domain-containing protein [Clostridia]RKQ32146.1 J domain-containing protein [Ruminococcus sp. B05]TAP36389.1 J domain-containing protein [Mediterraneibacter sp. gm002]